VKQAFLVDDSKSARIVLSRMLKKSGFDEVEMAESGEEALENLKQVTPDAIFVDFLMDGMDGLETITEIKKDPRFVDTPVVMCTANEGDEYVRAAVDHGALGILAKPPTHESLGEIIDMIEQHQMEVAANSETGSETEVAASPVSEQTATPLEAPSAPVSSLSEDDVRKIAEAVVAQQVDEQIENATGDAVANQVASAVTAYLDQQLEPLVARVVEQRIKALEPPEVDTESLQEEVVTQVNSQLEEFVRQLNQRTVEGLIEAAIYEQITEVANDFSQRLSDSEQKILSQVPDKNEMIDHIRVVTEGSIEAQVQETARQVAQEVSNSIATETVETLLDQQLTQQSLESQQPQPSSAWVWVAGLVVAAVAGSGVYFYLF
jgi:CheY-like chemotaxis protein